LELHLFIGIISWAVTIPDVLDSLCDEAIWFLSEDRKAEPSFMLVGQQKLTIRRPGLVLQGKYTGT
jgi:hypothetical protein